MTAAAILKDVALNHLVPVARIVGRCRSKRTVRAKKEVIKRLDGELGYSSVEIGDLLGLHHATVLHHLGRLSRVR